MHQMRDGSTVLDPRLGRLPQRDPRSAAYPIRRIVDQALPLRSYTWSVPVHLDQGQEGSCVGHAYAHELAGRPVVVKDVDHELAVRIYHEAQKADEWDGGSYPGAWPFYEGTSVLAGAKVLTEAGHYSSYHWADNEADVARAVGYAGPVVIGVNWYSGMFDPDRDGYLHPTGELAGGHAILVHSISVKGGYYWLFNSWGTSWGVEGRAKLSRRDMAWLLAQNGEACLPLRQKIRNP